MKTVREKLVAHAAAHAAQAKEEKPMDASEALKTLIGLRISNDDNAPDNDIVFKACRDGLLLQQGSDQIYMSWEDFERVTFLGALLLKTQEDRNDER